MEYRNKILTCKLKDFQSAELKDGKWTITFSSGKKSIISVNHIHVFASRCHGLPFISLAEISAEIERVKDKKKACDTELSRIYSETPDSSIVEEFGLFRMWETLDRKEDLENALKLPSSRKRYDVYVKNREKISEIFIRSDELKRQFETLIFHQYLAVDDEATYMERNAILHCLDNPVTKTGVSLTSIGKLNVAMRLVNQGYAEYLDLF